MGLLKIIILGSYAVLMSQFAHSQSIQPVSSSKIESRYRFENDASFVNLLQRWAIIHRYEVTFTGRSELPLVPELQSIQALTFREAIEKALDSYKNHDFGVVMYARIDDEKKHLYLSSATAKEPIKQTRDQIAVESGFFVRETDKSLIQVLVRWASQTGYQTTINGQLVNLDVFPRHPTNYPDYNLIDSAKTFKTQSSLKEAVNQLLIFYTGRWLAPFMISIDESTKRMSIGNPLK